MNFLHNHTDAHIDHRLTNVTHALTQKSLRMRICKFYYIFYVNDVTNVVTSDDFGRQFLSNLYIIRNVSFIVIFFFIFI